MRKVALVTGGAVRLGRAVTLGLAEAGYDLMVHYHSSEGPAMQTAREVEALGRRACTVRADLSGGAEVGRVVDAVSEAYGRLDLLVNGAASFEQADLLDVDEEAWDRVMATNLKGPFLLVRAAASLLRESRGSIVNMVDLSAFQPWVRYPHHGVSKAGLMHLTRVLARVMAPHVRVNAIAPGAVLPPDDFDEDDRKRELARTPVGHLGSPDDVVRTVLFLAASPFITGEAVVVDGGRSLDGPSRGG
ncbi:MAG: SDR family oxidoreductase [Gemmatimonadetes bacterium]|nr:SDR family oxidoreductase [Gemmatimonadota bacterium]MBT8405406.1 SDR family oxidoreductase [Gemmatimonadota bacterium]NNK62735.1 SDR family oxidoreductase [Gemmatimonadota bacterium]